MLLVLKTQLKLNPHQGTQLARNAGVALHAYNDYNWRDDLCIAILNHNQTVSIQ